MTAPRRCVSSPAPLPGLRSPSSSPGPRTGAQSPDRSACRHRYPPLPPQKGPSSPADQGLPKQWAASEREQSAAASIPQPPRYRGSSLPTAPAPFAARPRRVGKEDAPTILAGKARRSAAVSAEDAAAGPGLRLPWPGAGRSRRAPAERSAVNPVRAPSIPASPRAAWPAPLLRGQPRAAPALHLRQRQGPRSCPTLRITRHGSNPGQHGFWNTQVKPQPFQNPFLLTLTQVDFKAWTHRISISALKPF